MRQYIWQSSSWPNFTWSADALLRPLSDVRKLQGRFLRSMEDLGFAGSLQAYAAAVEEDAMQTSAIEGEKLDRESVRSSIATHLGLPSAGLRQALRAENGLVEVLLDATHNYDSPLSAERLFGWHAALFPAGHSGLHSIVAGAWRQAPMQVLSGRYGRQKVHFEAPPFERLDVEMASFFSWWE
jgi:Fic family protein